MNCETATSLLPLLVYEELSPEQEDLLRAHLERCSSCQAAFELEQRLHQALTSRSLEPELGLLASCRRELGLRLTLAAQQQSWLVRAAWKLAALSKPLALAGRVAAAGALVMFGFLLARWTGGGTGAVRGELPTPENTARIRLIEPAAGDQVRIIIEETRQRVLTGSLDQEPVLEWLMRAARQAPDPGLRAESVGLLGSRVDREVVRNALLEAVQRDPNPAVRLKALEALKPFAVQSTVRQVLARVLLTDDNPGVRIQAIDTLIQQRQHEALVGLLQALLDREENSYVRLRCRQALRELNASAGTF